MEFCPKEKITDTILVDNIKTKNKQTKPTNQPNKKSEASFQVYTLG